MRNDHEDEQEKETPDSSRFSPIEANLEKRFLEQRRVFLWGQVDDTSARYVIERILYLNELDRGKEITLMINSPGGLNTSGFAILDVMNGVESPISTLCLGFAASFGALLLISGEKGRRFVTPHARVMLHQPWIPGRVEGPTSMIRIQAQEIEKQRHEINRIIAECSNQDMETIEGDTDRDRWFTASEALEYGLIDGIYRDWESQKVFHSEVAQAS